MNSFPPEVDILEVYNIRRLLYFRVLLKDGDGLRLMIVFSH
jgi:hypothetical protein